LAGLVDAPGGKVTLDQLDGARGGSDRHEIARIAGSCGGGVGETPVDQHGRLRIFELRERGALRLWAGRGASTEVLPRAVLAHPLDRRLARDRGVAGGPGREKDACLLLRRADALAIGNVGEGFGEVRR